MKYSILLLILFSGCVLADPSSPGTLEMQVDGEYLSIRAVQVPLADLIAELERQVDADLNIREIEDRPVTFRSNRISIDELLSRLNINYALIYLYDSETDQATLEGGWGVSYKGGQPVRNSLLLPRSDMELMKQAMRPYEEQVTNGLPSVYPVIYPASARVDGDFSDWPSNMPWHVVGGRMGSYRSRPSHQDPADLPAYPPVGDEDISYVWGAMMDDDYLYVAVKVYDDHKIVMESPDPNLIFLDDSVEFYIDGGNEKGTSYDGNDSQIAIARGEDWDDPAKPRISPWVNNGRGIPGSQSGIEAVVRNGDASYTVESRIPLETFEILPENQLAFGFNIHVNDDDDGGVRDHKIMWSAIEQTGGEQSYHNPSVFGNMSIVDLRQGAAGED